MIGWKYFSNLFVERTQSNERKKHWINLTDMRGKCLCENESDKNNNNNENWYHDDVFIMSIKRSNEASSKLKNEREENEFCYCLESSTFSMCCCVRSKQNGCRRKRNTYNISLLLCNCRTSRIILLSFLHFSLRMCVCKLCIHRAI